jgi:UDP-N-acetylmuramoylalanine--D-glutamate ligase
MELNHKKLLIVGFGRTGQAVCRFALDQGARITVSESRSASEMEIDPSEWEERGVAFEWGRHRTASFLSADLIVPSPGVPPLPLTARARERGVAVVSEVELAFRFLKGTIIGVTGSNGKSTVVTLIHGILHDAGRAAFLAGNIGVPLISFVEGSRADHIYVTELSSFQLAYTRSFRPGIAVFLNITGDHLDWHGDFEDYFSAKRRILANLGREESAVLNRDDPLVWGLRDMGPFRVLGFSSGGETSPGSFIRQGKVMLATEGSAVPLMAVEEIPIPGRHNQENVMAAALASTLMGISRTGIRSSILGFKGLEHRLERVLSIEGVEFYNDSKATNIDAALKSLASLSRPLVLILGGRDKGGDFTQLRKPIAQRVKRCVLLGEAADVITEALRGTVPMERAVDMRDAVRRAYAAADPGDIVLLAPACTSFDMFQSFEHRGRIFKQEVHRLNKERVGDST